MLSRNTKLHIVKASLEDEEGVMRASEDVYAGLDYLPSLYRTWIQEGDKEDPRRFNFVVQIDSEIVGFFSLMTRPSSFHQPGELLRVTEPRGWEQQLMSLLPTLRRV